MKRQDPPTPTLEELEALERDPFLDALRGALSESRAPDPGDAFFHGLSDDIMRDVESLAEASARPVIAPTRASWLDRLRDFFSSPVRAGGFATAAMALMLLVWIAPWSDDPANPAPVSPPGSEGIASTDDDEDDSSAFEEDLSALSSIQLEQLDTLLESSAEPDDDDGELGDEDADPMVELATLDTTTLAALDLELQRAFPSSNERRQP